LGDLIFTRMPRKKKFILLLTLGLLTAVGPFSIDMYLPGFPDIADNLGTTVSRISLSLSSFFIGISFGQLLYGPLLDRFGRKKPLYAGLTLYILASMACAFAGSVNALIGWRLFEALGGCVGMVAARAMVRDIFPVNENAKVFSTLMLVVGVSPIIAPTAGGYLTALVGWRSVFWVLTLMGIVILLLVHFKLPESRKADSNISLKPKPILAGFAAVLKEPRFYTYALTGSVAASGLYAYISGSPYVFMQIYHVSEKQYGWIFAIIAFGLITATQINTLMLKRFSSQQIIRVALGFQVLSGVCLLTGSLMGWLGLYSTILLLFMFLSCQGFTFPNSSALCMAPFSRNAGTASALMGGIQMAIGATTSALVSYLNNHTDLPMTGTMAACSSTALIIFLTGKQIIDKKASLPDIQEKNTELISTT
jgi:DHA1 family bicyclomycin/chloramphenicol resistance-like MFS transporter